MPDLCYDSAYRLEVHSPQHQGLPTMMRISLAFFIFSSFVICHLSAPALARDTAIDLSGYRRGLWRDGARRR